MNRKVLKKQMFLVKIRLVSPLCISNGDGTETDNDVIRYYDGEPFVPGSSLAGAMREYIGKESNECCFLGNSETVKDAGDDKMSTAYISDVVFDRKANCAASVLKRDSVGLSDDKTAETEKKFDMEAVETGNTGAFFIELVIREGDDETQLQKELQKIFSGISYGEIRFGYKKTRGYGRVSIESIQSITFDKDNILDYKDAYETDTYRKEIDRKDTWISESDCQYIHMKTKLELDGCISIRQYSAKKGEPDYVHVTANGDAVIPGTSMAGAFRHRAKEFMRELCPNNNGIGLVIDEMFGFVTKKESKTEAKRSPIVFGESVLEDSESYVYTRNAISRFEAGTKDRALFKELVYHGGTIDLEIMVRKGELAEAFVGLLLLIMKDVELGFLPIGGQASIGRGIFKKWNPTAAVEIRGADSSLVEDVSKEDYYLTILNGWISNIRGSN